MPDHPELSAATLGLHAGNDERRTGTPFLAGPVFASAFHLPGDQTGVKYQYGRFDNPTWSALEEVIGKLESGPAVTFASGVAATAAVLTPFVRPGDAIVLPDDGYFATRSYAQTYLARWGVTVRLLPTTSMASADFSGVRLVWIETPSNPSLDVCDIEALAARAHAAGALLAVDNTTATVLSQAPLRHGADFSVASDTKAFNGHSDVVFGHVAARDPELLKAVRQWRTLAGAIPGPMEAWLVHRGLATLDLRLARQSQNALAIATLLTSHPAVTGVRYPGLASDPSHAIARRQMRYFGAVVSFELASAAVAQRFLGSCDMLFEATSFGGMHSSAERRARWGTDRVSEGFIRLSAGCEATDDLVAAIGAALDAL
ncbi:MAG: cystathionine gamma-lyase [Caldimonas sp.]